MFPSAGGQGASESRGHQLPPSARIIDAFERNGGRERERLHQQSRTYRASGVAQADGSCYAHVPKTRRPRRTLSIHCRSLIHHVSASALCWCCVLVSCSGASIFRGDLRKQHLTSLRGISSSVYPHVRASAPRSMVSDFGAVMASPESPAIRTETHFSVHLRTHHTYIILRSSTVDSHAVWQTR